MKMFVRLFLLVFILLSGCTTLRKEMASNTDFSCPVSPDSFITDQMNPRQKHYVQKMAKNFTYNDLIDYEQDKGERITKMQYDIHMREKNKQDKQYYQSDIDELNTRMEEYNTGLSIINELRPLKRACFYSILDKEGTINLDYVSTFDLRYYQTYIIKLYVQSRVTPSIKDDYDKYIVKFRGERVDSAINEGEMRYDRLLFDTARVEAYKQLKRSKYSNPKKYSKKIEKEFIDACTFYMHYYGLVDKRYANMEPFNRAFEPNCKRIYEAVSYYKEMDIEDYTPYLTIKSYSKSSASILKNNYPKGGRGVIHMEPIARFEFDEERKILNFVNYDMQKLLKYQKMHIIFLEERKKEAQR